MNVGKESNPFGMNSPRTITEVPPFKPRTIKADSANLVPSVSSRSLTWIIFPFPGHVESRNLAPWKSSRPWTEPKSALAAAAHTYLCKPTFRDGTNRTCSKNCTHNGYPLNRYACSHNDEAATVSVSKIGSDRSILLVENLALGHLSLGIQYDTGCQLSLISRSVLRTLPTSMYSQGKSTRVRVLTYAREEKIILTTEIKLKLFGLRCRLCI